MRLTIDQIEILKNWKIEDNRFYIQWQLDRKQYLDINKVLEAIWLKWNRWKKAHIAEWLTQEDLENAIDDICETWEVETLQETIKKFQFYPTPKEVAEYLVELADIKEDETVLEPSAWKWHIAENISRKNSLTMIELNKDNYKDLTENSSFKDDEIINMDFMDYNEKKFDKIIANPPFSKSQDVKHILHMYELLNEWWRIVSIASAWIKFREWKVYNELRELNPEFIELPEWSFKDSWTMVNSVIVLINK